MRECIIKEGECEKERFVNESKRNRAFERKESVRRGRRKLEKVCE